MKDLQTTPIELFASCGCRLSESPMWNDRDDALYWRGLDGEIFRKKMGTPPDEYQRFALGIGGIGSMVFTDTDVILLFGENGKIWKWIPHTPPVLYKDFGGALFNDVLCDAHGRVYCGMLAKNYFESNRGKHGSFWRLDPNGEWICIDDQIATTPNGIRINSQKDTLYFAITDDDCIYAYDYDQNTGKLSNRRVFANHCCPDGIAIDQSGNLWVTDCRPSNSRLLCYAKDGRLLDEWKLPVRRVISVAFGGADRTTLFITTAHEGAPKGQYDGGVFMMKTNVIGGEEYRFPLKSSCL